MSMDDQKRLLLQARALRALRDRIAREEYLTVKEVCASKKISRTKLESIPIEVLPYMDVGETTREYRRYHPADVAALDARMRRWQRAKRVGEAEGRADLAELRAELDAADEASIELARESRRGAA